ncbi:PDF receptor-like isoform X2 [Apostichopus japonicus]|uniref:PDF receptor-like isoform X2 n=1 Tax=Stichopus japonicus TaxID=307972 RepID=UPI003AB8D6E9
MFLTLDGFSLVPANSCVLCHSYLTSVHTKVDLQIVKMADNGTNLLCLEVCKDYDYDVVCWPETANGTISNQPCPDTPFTDPTQLFERLCQPDGQWEDVFMHSCIKGEFSRVTIPPSSTEQHDFLLLIVAIGRIIRLTGSLISWLSLLLALVIFASFRSLKCNRTKIHVHLFTALLIRLTIDVVFDINNILKYKAGNDFRAADNILGLCEALHIVSTYSTLCAFAWMFVEGLYLNTLISSAVFGRPNFIRYYIIAWVLPIPFVLAWSIAMFATYSRCWPLHTDSPYYLALIEIPRDIIFILNSVFLLHIIYVLVTKLKNNNSGETQVIRKAVKALFVLLPLLGISHLLWRLPHPQATSPPTVIVIYHVGISFFYSFQGFAVALLFCFLNKEVRVLIKRKWRIWVNFMDTPMRRTSMITSTSDVRINLVMMNGKFNE